MNKLYFGDNLEVMQKLSSESIDLIATDPPFNSGRNHNIFLKDSKTKKRVFNDVWKWDTVAQETRYWIRDRAEESEIYNRINRTLDGYDLILEYANQGPQGKMRSYLSFISPRLVEIYRLLKDTGTLYLHCDPKASHYIKGILDSIFGIENFGNEIVWHYSVGNPAKFHFKRKHDIIFRYMKSKNFVFNQPRMSYLERDLFQFRYTDDDGRKYRVIPQYGKVKRFYWDDGTAMDDVFTYVRKDGINSIRGKANERSGFPTQKPVKLYKLLIESSSHEGDMVFDPFAGCGTTIDAAQSLGRKWIGIDITDLALAPIEKRLKENYELEAEKDYQVYRLIKENEKALD